MFDLRNSTHDTDGHILTPARHVYCNKYRYVCTNSCVHALSYACTFRLFLFTTHASLVVELSGNIYWSEGQLECRWEPRYEARMRSVFNTVFKCQKLLFSHSENGSEGFLLAPLVYRLHAGRFWFRGRCHDCSMQGRVKCHHGTPAVHWVSERGHLLVLRSRGRR